MWTLNMKKIACILVMMSLPVAAHAEGAMSADHFYVGGGFNFNSLPGWGSSQGFQFLGGYDFSAKWNDDISTAVEIGYLDTGNFSGYKGGSSDDVKGVWASAVESVPLSSKTDMLVRLGYDFGDDDGLLMGLGMQYKFNTKLALRMEYVARNNVTGLQANVLFHF